MTGGYARCRLWRVVSSRGRGNTISRDLSQLHWQIETLEGLQINYQVEKRNLNGGTLDD